MESVSQAVVSYTKGNMVNKISASVKLKGTGTLMN
jgi:hypothetical protein